MPGNTIFSVELPVVPSIGNYRVGTTINSSPYVLDVRWNSREEAWYIDFRQVDETLIAAGVKVVLGAYLGRWSDHKLFRDGVLLAMDTSGERREATFDDLGTRVILQYIPVLELLRRLREFS